MEKINAFKRGIERFSNLLTSGKKSIFARALFFLLFLTPVISLTAVSYSKIYREYNKSIISQKRALAFLAANIVRGRLDLAVDMGISLATRPRLVEEIEGGNWPEAINNLSGITNHFQFIDRVILYDSEATLKASSPSFPEVIGESRTYRDWYRWVSNNWQPYVSDVYQRGTPPRINVVSVVVPIKTKPFLGLTASTAAEEGRKVIGILQLQLKLESFHEWVKKADTGQGVIVYIVDQYGRIVSHPRFNSKEQIVDFSSVPAVQELLKGKSGAGINYNPIEKEVRLAAFEPVAGYRWGVVVTQPVKLAFASRDKSLRHLLFIYSIAILLTSILAIAILQALIINKRAQEVSRKLAAIVESSDDGIISKTLNGVILSWNKGAEHIYGYRSEEAVGKSILLIIPPEKASEMPQIIERIKNGDRIEHYETVRRRKDGVLIYVSLTVSPVKNGQGQIEAISTITRDITVQKKAEEQLRKVKDELLALSLTDPLTGLYNRRGFEILAQQQIKLAKRNKQEVIIFFVDADNMKWINDNLGHHEGDLAIVEIANLLKMCFRETDIIARLGGDEFVVLAMINNIDIAKDLAVKLQEKMDERNINCAPRHPLSLSIGFAGSNANNPLSLEKLLNQADKMMYVEKVRKKTDGQS